MKSFRPAKRSQACISTSKKVVEVSGYGAAYLPFWHSSSLVYVSLYVGAYRYSWVARIDGLIKGRERLERCQISIEPSLPNYCCPASASAVLFPSLVCGQVRPSRLVFLSMDVHKSHTFLFIALRMHPIGCKSGKKGHEDCDKGSQ
jgi:hypothetical protein